MKETSLDGIAAEGVVLASTCGVGMASDANLIDSQHLRLIAHAANAVSRSVSRWSVANRHSSIITAS